MGPFGDFLQALEDLVRTEEGEDQPDPGEQEDLAGSGLQLAFDEGDQVSFGVGDALHGAQEAIPRFGGLLLQEAGPGVAIRDGIDVTILEELDGQIIEVQKEDGGALIRETRRQSRDKGVHSGLQCGMEGGDEKWEVAARTAAIEEPLVAEEFEDGFESLVQVLIGSAWHIRR